MKKFFINLVLLVLLLTPVAAFEWGGLFTEDFKVSAPEAQFDNLQYKQSNSVSLWMNAPITEDGATYFTAQGNVKYFLDITNGDLLFTPLLDVELVKFAGKVNIFQSQISYALGRFSVSDLTGKIFSQMSDGAMLKYTLSSLEATAYVGYTGFLNGLTVSMIGNEGVADYITGSMYGKAHTYIPLSLSLEMPYAFLNQTFSTQLSAFIDMEESAYNRAYASLSLYGPVFGPLYYSLLTTIGVVNFADIMNYSSLSLQMFLTSSVTVKINTEYASGENAIFKPFVGFTSNPVSNSLSSPELSGVIVPNFDLMLSTNNLFIGLNGKLIIGCPEDEIYAQGVNIAANFIYNIFSDLQLGLSGSYYLDLYTDGLENNLSVNLNVSMSF